MGNADSIRKNILPLLESLDKYHQYRSENSTLDDDDSGFSVFLHKDGEDPVPLAKPSLALFHGDSVLYEQECKRLRLSRLNEVLRPELFHRNLNNFNDLLPAIRVNKITPFIGAGSSVSAGCQSWSAYLKTKAQEVELSEEQVEPLLAGNQYEELLELIIAQPRGNAFEFYFQQDFNYADPEKSFSWILPQIFQGCVITTNFDRVIEECYARQGLQFTEKCEGLNNPHNFIKAMTRGERYLLKLHGNIDRPDYRVFKKEEYQRAYCQEPELLVDMAYPLPSLLADLYRSHSFLFLGCSLDVDRTVKTFELVFSGDTPQQQESLRQKVADHFAIIEQPEDPDKLSEMEVRLHSCNVKPIWYEFGRHDKVTDILQLMLI